MAEVIDLINPEMESAPPAKISNYHIVRNTKNLITYSITPRVVSQDVKKLAYFSECADTEVYVENRCIMLTGPQKAESMTNRAYLKLHPNYEAKILEVEKPPRGGLFVTVPKVGAQIDGVAGIEPLDPMITGRDKRRIIGPDGNDLPTSKGGLPGVPDPDGVVRPWPPAEAAASKVEAT
mmetsp:Transcript_10107/g.26165  ORF Transcript_10107/g.26165 Transcript_10107/m.26165 type:complete len:179 (+) Transcript_10107:78-614(+)